MSKGTVFHGLHFSRHLSLDLRAYSNADWDGDPTDRRSTTSYCFFLDDSLISWCSKKQAVVSCSSTKAEYRALADTVSELIWLRWLLQNMGVSQLSTTPLRCDNRSAVQITHNDVFYEHTKHNENYCHFIRHHILQGTIRLIFVFSTYQNADTFTKAYSPRHFHDLVSKLQLSKSSATLSLRGDVRIFHNYVSIFCIYFVIILGYLKIFYIYNFPL